MGKLSQVGAVATDPMLGGFLKIPQKTRGLWYNRKPVLSFPSNGSAAPIGVPTTVGAPLKIEETTTYGLCVFDLRLWCIRSNNIRI